MQSYIQNPEPYHNKNLLILNELVAPRRSPYRFSAQDEGLSPISISNGLCSHKTGFERYERASDSIFDTFHELLDILKAMWTLDSYCRLLWYQKSADTIRLKFYP